MLHHTRTIEQQHRKGSTIMRKSVTAAAMAVSIALGGAAGVAIFGPSGASAQSTTTTPAPGAAPAAPSEKPRWAQDALKKLVDDGVITQAQADAVIKALQDARPHPGARKAVIRREGLAAAAKAIGIDENVLRDALKGGKTLGQVAADHGVDRQKVIDALVAETKTRTAAAVAAGKITQEQADKLNAAATQRIPDVVDGKAPLGALGGRGRGHRAGGPKVAPSAATAPAA
jgi:hypothetical protein